MDLLLAPFFIALVAWWFSTGAILALVHHVRIGPSAVLWGAGVTSALAIGTAAFSASQTDATSAYLAFFCALTVWGAIEVTFLTGLVTGPNRAECPAGARGLQRFRLAAATLIYHEVLIVVLGLALLAATWGQPNQAATLTYLTLALMRISAKFNLFLGAPSLSEELMPHRLSYLRSYFRRGLFNPVFPVSMLGGALAAGLSAASALSAPANSGAATTGALLFALIVLALLEHALMMTPLDDGILWRWTARLRSSDPTRTSTVKTIAHPKGRPA